jgi:transcriptional regulator with XRE-family HTH domain
MQNDIAEAIKKEYDQGMGYKELAQKYRMSFRTLSRILKGEGSTVPSSTIENEIEKLKIRIDALEQKVLNRNVPESEGNTKVRCLCGHTFNPNETGGVCPSCKGWINLKHLRKE